MTPVPAVRLILVRHARPAVVPGAPAPLWELGSDGRRAARALGAAAPPAACLVASDEPKALQTLQEMAGDRPVAAEPGFREVRRPAVWSGSYRALARAYAAGAAVGTHGLALTVWLASRMPLAPDPAAFWAALQFPDLIEVNLSARTAARWPG